MASRSAVIVFGALVLLGFALLILPQTLSGQDRAREEENIARAERGERVPGQYIVVFKDSVADADAAEAELLSNVAGARLDSYRYALRGFSARLSDADVAALSNDPRVAFVSEDREVSITRHNALSAQGQTLPTGVNRINAAGLTNTGAGVDVAVIDTGILSSHPDLSGKVVGGKNCTRGSGGYSDQNGHGTHVAGTIAANNNTQGVIGVAPGAKLWSVRVLDKRGSGTWSTVICGIDYVTSKAPKNGGPIDVANMSLGGGGSSDNNCGNSNNDALHKAICRARDAGVTIVVAAGNSGANAAKFAPAAYDDAVITVSALADSNGVAGGGGPSTNYGADDTFATFSNWGSPVDIGAPGVSIYSTYLSNGYATMSGTSMASPHVAGVAALYLAKNPGASWSTVRDALISLGEGLGAGHTDPSGSHPEVVVQANAL